VEVIGHLNRAAHRRPHVADAVVAAVVLLVTLLTTTVPGNLRDEPSLPAAFVACGALLARRRRPYTVLIVSTVAAEIYLAGFHGRTGMLVLAAPLIALYTVAEHTDRRRALVAGGVLVFAVGATHTFGIPDRLLGPENLALVALGALAVAAADASRNRRAYLAEAVRRAQDAQRSAEAEARRRVTEERLRIARELHDSVGHHLALINVQAGVAGHVLAGDQTEIGQALEAIRVGSRTALLELRDSVGLLRQPGEALPSQPPAAGLAGRAELLETFRRAGLRITETVDGRPRPLPWATDHTAYRVLQEALTNVRKHAGPGDVRVALHYEPDALTVIVENDGGPVAAADEPPAHGLVGMRERVTAVGGTLHAGPRPGGGFRVSAVLPAAS
jgi:signal transduction histidine kinase